VGAGHRAARVGPVGGLVSLTLLLETSSHLYSAALVDGAEVLEYRETTRTAPDYDGVPGLVAAALATRGRPFRDIATIAVDVGPGNLTSVRSGVAYANALSYSTGLRLLGPNSLELLALSARAAGRAAVRPSARAAVRDEDPSRSSVLALRKAGGSTVYAGLFGGDGEEPAYAVGDLAEVVNGLVKRMASDRPVLTVAGAFRDRVAEALPDGSVVTDSGLDTPDARVIHSWFLASLARHPEASTDLLVPLTENSGLFDA
jgi:tRNA threonylcarbamoyladenosine biosynthesis protein TsaB